MGAGVGLSSATMSVEIATAANRVTSGNPTCWSSRSSSKTLRGVVENAPQFINVHVLNKPQLLAKNCGFGIR